MFVIPREPIASAAGAFRSRTIYNVDEATGREWVAKLIADETTELPDYVRGLFSRLEPAAADEDKPFLFLPFIGEFGHAIMSHVRIVHFHKAKRKVVCCRPGEEVLYPSAAEFITDWADPIHDVARIATMPDAKPDWSAITARFPDHVPHVGAHALTPEQEIFAIHPTQRIPLAPKPRGLKADVVLGVRKREFQPKRNWEHWLELAAALDRAGLSFAVIGDRATSQDLPGQVAHSGDLDTAAAVELLQQCRVFVGTDSGTSHLAALVGCPMVVFRETGTGSRDLTPRMDVVNPGHVNVVAGGWILPDVVASVVIAAAIAATPRKAADPSPATTIAEPSRRSGRTSRTKPTK